MSQKNHLLTGHEAEVGGLLSVPDQLDLHEALTQNKQTNKRSGAGLRKKCSLSVQKALGSVPEPHRPGTVAKATQDWRSGRISSGSSSATVSELEASLGCVRPGSPPPVSCLDPQSL